MNQPIKLAIVGASSTGKTTLWETLRVKYKTDPSIVFVHESAREYFSQKTVSIDFSLTNQEQILELALKNEQDALSRNPKMIITDTTPIETVFYTQIFGDEMGAKKLLAKVQPSIKTYTKFLLLNPDDVQFENDEIRTESKETRDTIHRLMVDFYHKYNLPFELISGTIPERQKRITDIIHVYLSL